MSRFDWLSEWLARCEDEHILIRRGSARTLAPAHLVECDPEDWGRIAAVARDFGCRWVALWGSDEGGEETPALGVQVAFEYGGDHLVVRTRVPRATPVLSSHSPWFAAADRPERHCQDLFGVVFLDHPDARRWTRHGAWGDGDYPLRKDFAAAGQPPAETPPDQDYPFLAARGEGVYEIPVGPVHAGIIEPGHFRFQAVGETILNLEERLGYVHKGIEKIAEGRTPEALARLAGRISGDTTVAHAWAACMALERATRTPVPGRALFLRALAAERERIANHLGDIGAICNDVGFAFAQYQFSRLREDWLRGNQRLCGHRLLMDWVVPGGIARDPDPSALAAMAAELDRLEAELAELYAILDDNPSLEDRLSGTGRLTEATARQLGTLGYVARASGLAFDLRAQAPYPPYDTLEVEVPVLEQGDVLARVRVRREEIRVSLALMRRFLAELPAGEIRQPLAPPVAGVEGLGLVEGWRGEILAHVRLHADGTIDRFFARDPSWLNWPALERIVRNNIVPDFPVCNKSVNGSYSGQDL